MKVVRVLALIILSFLLFLSLFAFGWAFMLNSALLNPDFAVREVEKLDITALVEEQLVEQAMQFGLPESYAPYVADIMVNTVADLEPWMKEQVATVIHTGYDYLLGESRSWSLAISLEPVRESLKENLREVFLISPPPELQGLPPDAMEMLLGAFSRQVDEQIPPVIEFDQTMLDQLEVSQLEQVKQYIGYFQLGYNLVIGFILLLILGIVLLYREVRGASRSLGITFLTGGVITYLGSFALGHVLSLELAKQSLPASLQVWLPQVLADGMSLLDIYGIVVGAIGVALLVVSVFYKPRLPE